MADGIVEFPGHGRQGWGPAAAANYDQTQAEALALLRSHRGSFLLLLDHGDEGVQIFGNVAGAVSAADAVQIAERPAPYFVRWLERALDAVADAIEHEQGTAL